MKYRLTGITRPLPNASLKVSLQNPFRPSSQLAYFLEEKKKSYPLLGDNGLLNPPTRFIYCLYSLFFLLLTP